MLARYPRLLRRRAHWIGAGATLVLASLGVAVRWPVGPPVEVPAPPLLQTPVANAPTRPGAGAPPGSSAWSFEPVRTSRVEDFAPFAVTEKLTPHPDLRSVGLDAGRALTGGPDGCRVTPEDSDGPAARGGGTAEFRLEDLDERGWSDPRRVLELCDQLEADESIFGALNALRRGLTRSPGNRELSLRLARTLSLAGQHAEARSVAFGALVSDPSDGESLETFRVTLAAAGWVDEFAPTILAVIDRFPYVAPLYLALASFLVEAGSPDEAEDVLRHGAMVGSYDPDTWRSLADFLANQGRHREAAEIFTELAARPSGDGEWDGYVWLQAGRALLAVGDPSRAASALAQACAASPEYCVEAAAALAGPAGQGGKRQGN